MNSNEKVRKTAVSALLIGSLGCLFAGFSQPVLHVSVQLDLSLPNLPISGRYTMFEGSHSLPEAIAVLYRKGFGWLATLVLLTSVLLPVVNILLQGTSLWIAEGRSAVRLERICALLSKWAMTEVFVASLLLAIWLMDAQRFTDARPGAGFYWYAAHCLAALAAVSWLGWGRMSR
jgi:uncharacterized paraquat-inducible protein A